MRYLCFLFALTAYPLFCQTSSFEQDNEGWSTDGDAVGGDAYWQNAGGNPGGYILGIDGSTGGTWYFVAPSIYLGPKCDAYEHFLRYDQYVSSNAAPNNRPDVELKGGGITLVYDNPVLPGLTWTHFDILLREDAGWTVDNINGPLPTAEEFKQVLSDITSLRIRGEYYSNAEDEGGLDNVMFESRFSYLFDLDGDDSSGAMEGNYQAPATCIPTSRIADFDLKLITEARIDSIVIQILGASATDVFDLPQPPGNILLKRPAVGKMLLVNRDNMAVLADFIAALKQIKYMDNSPDPLPGVRVVQLRVYTDCGKVGSTVFAYLPIYVRPDAGLNGDTVLCHGGQAVDLRLAINGVPDTYGSWLPQLSSGANLFNPNVDTAGIYRYIIPEAAPCPGDTASVVVKIHEPFQLRPDTTVCYDKVLRVRVPAGLTDWRWSDGSQKVDLPVSEPGAYSLVGSTGYCTYSDSVVVAFYSCAECFPYPPNVFSPNDDGENDRWHIFLQCRWSDYHVEVYDRWGSMVFSADNPEQSWDGRVRGQDVQNGVYVWRMFWTGEMFGVPRTWYYEGDVTVMR